MKTWTTDSLYQNGCWQFGRKYPKCPRIYLPNLSAQAQKFWISMKKGFIWRPQSSLMSFNEYKISTMRKVWLNNLEPILDSIYRQFNRLYFLDQGNRAFNFRYVDSQDIFWLYLLQRLFKFFIRIQYDKSSQDQNLIYCKIYLALDTFKYGIKISKS